MSYLSGIIARLKGHAERHGKPFEQTLSHGCTIKVNPDGSLETSREHIAPSETEIKTFAREAGFGEAYTRLELANNTIAIYPDEPPLEAA